MNAGSANAAIVNRARNNGAFRIGRPS
jgi:hypothetical protein